MLSSYLHTEWATFSKLQAGDKRFESKMKRYKAKQEQLGVFANVSVNTSHTVACVKIILTCRLMMSHSTLSTQLLIEQLMWLVQLNQMARYTTRMLYGLIILWML